MQDRDVFLSQLVPGPKQFLFPIFQRTYSWTQSNCDQLLSDIVHAGESPYIQSHFVGSIALIPSQQTTVSIPQWQVIHGQQRLTTVSVLKTALLDKAKSLKHKVSSATQIDGIWDYFLANATLKGVYCDMRSKDDPEWIVRLVNQAYEEALA